MPVTGTKKVIKKEAWGRRTGIQFCIDGILVDEVLKLLPKNISIVGGHVILSEPRGNRKIPVPNAFKKMGVTYIHEQVANKSLAMLFDAVTTPALIAKVRKVASMAGIDYKRAYFNRLTLANSVATGSFARVTKELKPDETDLRKKLTVLGLRDAKGRIQDLLANLSAKKYVCDIEEVIYRTAICRPA